MAMSVRQYIRLSLCVKLGCIVFVLVLTKTASDARSPVASFRQVQHLQQDVQVLDRNAVPLSYSYQNRWNVNDNKKLHDIPDVLVKAFVASEDKRFYQHHGVDWLARASALWQRVSDGKASRGASTITEQVVRMLHPRPRTYWSKWLEGLEAYALEHEVNKADILEFYMNQVPYGRNRRGVVQAARMYFNRDISTLHLKEMLALVVLVRAPSAFDLLSGQVVIDDAITRLVNVMHDKNNLNNYNIIDLNGFKLHLDAPSVPAYASHFIDYVRTQSAQWSGGHNSGVKSTIDSNLQLFIESSLESRVRSLASKHVGHAAAVVIDYTTHEVLAWVSVGAGCKESDFTLQNCKVDMVRVPRQPGSALKPFLYAAALSKGWDAATILDDSPYSDSVGTGIHHVRNYSRSYYGKVTLRSALGNSLNVPALHAIHYVSPSAYLDLLLKLGFSSLNKDADFYDEGLALGNGEVTLFALAQAYAALANRGVFSPLHVTLQHEGNSQQTRIFSDEVASLIGNILSDPWARSAEFGRSSVLNLSTQTAVKTGTSTDYRDAWAVGYDHRYVVAIWMGNADYSPMDGITGSLGPALVLRSIFHELSQYTTTAPLYLSPKLEQREVCIDPEITPHTHPDCPRRSEYFIRDAVHDRAGDGMPAQEAIQIFRPANGLLMAMDPRVPARTQAFEMQLLGVAPNDGVVWEVDGHAYPAIQGSRFLWAMSRGKHHVKARVTHADGAVIVTQARHFEVR